MNFKNQLLLSFLLVTLFGFSKTTSNTPLPATPSGTWYPLPGVIEAENFSSGSTGVNAYGYLVGSIDDGDQIIYLVDITESGTYKLKARVASNTTGGEINLLLGTGNSETRQAIGSVSIGNTGGWENWTDVEIELQLTEGEYILYLDLAVPAINDGFNIDKLEFTKVTPTYVQIPATLQGEDYFQASTGVAVTNGNSQFSPTSAGGIKDGDQVSYLIDVNQTGDYLVELSASSRFNSLNFSVEGNDLGTLDLLPTNGFENFGSPNITLHLEAGQQTLILKASSSETDTELIRIDNIEFTFIEPVLVYTAIPALIEGEDYFQASSGVAVTNGNSQFSPTSVGGIKDGDQVSYLIDVNQTGDYLVELSASSRYSSLNFSVEGNDLGTLDLLPTNGFENFGSPSITLHLEAGQQTLILKASSSETDTELIRIDNIEFTFVEPIIIYATIPGIIQAEEFDVNVGTNIYNYLVGAIDQGDELEYNVNVTEPGLYRVEARLASNNNGGDLNIRFNKEDALNTTVTVSNTGGWENWTIIEAEVFLVAGEQTMDLSFVMQGGSDGFNIDYINFTKITPEHTVLPGEIEGENFSSQINANISTGNLQYSPMTVSANANTQTSYLIDVPQSGEYELELIASSYANTGITFFINGYNFGEAAFMSTNLFSNFASTVITISLPEGQNTLILDFDGQAGDNEQIRLDKMIFSYVGPYNTNARTTSNTFTETSEVNVHPTIATSLITIEGISKSTEWSIISSLGEKILQGSGTTIDVNNMDSGVYFIQGENFKTKFIKQ